VPAEISVQPKVPDHELLRLIGHGSYGEVWLARSVMGSWRAVKAIHRASFEHDRPFEREFSGIKRYEPVSRSHEGLVQVLHVGRSPDFSYFYYVMELADDASGTGSFDADKYIPKTLSRIGDQPAITAEQCVSIGLSLAGALGQLHRDGLLHRDVKPSNIILVHGRPKLADIGLVAQFGESRSVVGTEGFIPPEGTGTPQADIFALGKVLYEISTGLDRNEFPKLPREWLNAPSPNRTLLELNEVVLKACEANAARRYRSAEELHADLALIQVGRSVRRMRFIERRLKWMTRAGVAAVAVGLAASAFSVVAKRQAARDRSNLQRVERAEKETREQLGHSLLAEARARRRSPEAGRRFETLETIRKAAALKPSLELRNELIAALGCVDVRLVRDFSEFTATRQVMAFDPTLKRYAVGRTNGEISIRDVTDDRELSALPAGTGGRVRFYLYFSPDARWLCAYYEDRHLRAWDWERRKLVLDLPASDNLMFDVTPDNRELILRRDAGPLKFYTFTNGTLSRELNFTPSYRAWKLAPDGRRIALGNGRSIEVRSLDDQSLVSSFQAGSDASRIDWSPDGSQVAVAGADWRIQLFDSKLGAEQLTIPGHHGFALVVAFLPANGWIASSSWDGTTRLWDPITGEQALTMNRAGQSLQFSADGRMGLENFSSSRLEMFETVLPTHPAVFVPQSRMAQLQSISFSPDGQSICVASDDGVRLWRADSRLETQFVPSSRIVRSALFTPDGTALLISGEEGLFRCDVTSTSNGVLHMSEMQLIEGGEHGRAALSASGNLLAFVHFDHAHATNSARSVRLAGQNDLTFIAVSPDEKWIAGGARVKGGVTVWDATTGAVRWQFPARDGAQVAFTTDSRSLIAGASDEYVFWNLSNGTAGLRFARPPTSNLHGTVAVSPDGKLIAISSSRSLVQLCDARTGEEIATLESPSRQTVTSLAFSPDGTRLAVTQQRQTFHVWNLPALRRDLAAFGLDWPDR
jgi:WD40 repeat protein